MFDTLHACFIQIERSIDSLFCYMHDYVTTLSVIYIEKQLLRKWENDLK